MTPPDLSVHSVLGLTPAHPKLEGAQQPAAAVQRHNRLLCVRAWQQHRAQQRRPCTMHVRSLARARTHERTDVYELDRELGKGGFGVVHLAHNKTTGQQAAVKSISKARMVREDDIKAVQAEAAIMKLLGGHGNIVSLSVGMRHSCGVHDCWKLHRLSTTAAACSLEHGHLVHTPLCMHTQGVYEDKDTVYLAMELCEGGELFERIVEEQTFTERKVCMVCLRLLLQGRAGRGRFACCCSFQAAEMFKKMVESIKHCHEQGVTHRDLKVRAALLLHNSTVHRMRARAPACFSASHACGRPPRSHSCCLPGLPRVCFSPKTSCSRPRSPMQSSS